MSSGSALRPVVQLSGAVAVTLNVFLVFVLVKYSTKTIGFYKWLLVSYAIYEVLYATVVILTIPTHTIVDNSWVVFTYNGMLDYKSFLGPGLYCGFYLLWICHLTVMFVYRYVVVTKDKWVHQIHGSIILKFLLISIYILLVIYCFICGLYFCSQNPMTDRMRQELYEKFGVWEPGYIELDYHTKFGIISFTDHHTMLLAAIIIIPFCAIKMWKHILNIQKESLEEERTTAEIRLSRQIVLTLVAQTGPPIVLYLFPSIFLFSYPVWPDGIFGVVPHLLSIFTTLPKILDPIMVFVFVQDYRTVVLRILLFLRCIPATSIFPLTTTTEATTTV